MRIALKLEYDGTAYAGWQRQANAMTVQQAIEQALTKLTGESVQIIGAGRTDAGVHARGQVCAFDTEFSMPVEKMFLPLNVLLPEDIRVLESYQAEPDFHPVFWGKRKCYRYTILNRAQPSALYRNRAWHIPTKLNWDKLQEAALYLLGEHDFSAFMAAGGQVKTTVRTLYEINITQEEDLYHIDFIGSGFLYRMVRIMVGTLIYTAQGKIAPADIQTILDSGQRRNAGKTAPPQGLYLQWVEFDRTCQRIH